MLGWLLPAAVQECQQLGIDSRNIRAGLLGLTAELPTLVGAAVESLQAEQVTQALDYYAAVTAQQQEQPGSEPGQLLPVLAEVREGRTAPPQPAASDPAAADGGSGEAESSGTGLQVEWDLGAALEAVGGGEAGSDSAAGPGGGGISWELDAADLAAAGEEGAPPGVSWDAGAQADGGDEAQPDGADGAPAGISWDIDISGTGETEQQAAEAGGGDGGAPASQAPAPTPAAEAEEWPATVRRLVEDAAYRARLLDDLYELRAFLMQVPVWSVQVVGDACCQSGLLAGWQTSPAACSWACRNPHSCLPRGLHSPLCGPVSERMRCILASLPQPPVWSVEPR